ncbi:hypothetical protein [Guptibacillus algicola]|uniref:hypothetical protein n=1 Tax=Guptibacillus algicola TaxID=225844 RepID=UPI001CD63C31|nr:hypothetical protein [Alkalihalobacillus algicola]MCA0986776.1 hypothetical protein [Alkalihalobacillus algicola]
MADYKYDYKFPTVNDVHDQSLVYYFMEQVGKRILIMSPAFPFIIIGIILETIDDYLVVDVETTNIAELENRDWFIHIHDIEVFYVENGGPPIPKLKDGYC